MGVQLTETKSEPVRKVPNVSYSLLRLVSAVLMEMEILEGWETGRSYLKTSLL